MVKKLVYNEIMYSKIENVRARNNFNLPSENITPNLVRSYTIHK